MSVLLRDVVYYLKENCTPDVAGKLATALLDALSRYTNVGNVGYMPLNDVLEGAIGLPDSIANIYKYAESVVIKTKTAALAAEKRAAAADRRAAAAAASPSGAPGAVAATRRRRAPAAAAAAKPLPKVMATFEYPYQMHGKRETLLKEFKVPYDTHVLMVQDIANATFDAVRPQIDAFFTANTTYLNVGPVVFKSAAVVAR